MDIDYKKDLSVKTLRSPCPSWALTLLQLYLPLHNASGRFSHNHLEIRTKFSWCSPKSREAAWKCYFWKRHKQPFCSLFPPTSPLQPTPSFLRKTPHSNTTIPSLISTLCSPPASQPGFIHPSLHPSNVPALLTLHLPWYCHLCKHSSRFPQNLCFSENLSFSAQHCSLWLNQGLAWCLPPPPCLSASSVIGYSFQSISVNCLVHSQCYTDSLLLMKNKANNNSNK